MPGQAADNRFPSDNLWGLSCGLGIVGLMAWIYAIHHVTWDSREVAVLAVAVTCTVFSAACAVLVGLKSTEARIAEDQRKKSSRDESAR
jgi:uncharacterized membrane protein